MADYETPFAETNALLLVMRDAPVSEIETYLREYCGYASELTALINACDELAIIARRLRRERLLNEAAAAYTASMSTETDRA